MIRRFGRLALLLPHYTRTAWRGLLAHRLPGTPAHHVAQAVVLRDGKVLLTVRSALRGWELPGGRVNPGERPEQAVVREVAEETGLRVEVERAVGRYHRRGFLPHTAFVFRCRAREGRLRPSPETPRVAWWDLGALPGTLFPWYHEPLRDALPERAPPVERIEHQGLRAIATGMRIDLRMRISGDRAR